MAIPVPAPTQYPEIPDKLYFRIGEVARLAGVKPYVLRYWETEFPGLGPKKSGSNHRLYRRKDVEMVFDIKHLLYDKRYTIEGARKVLIDQRMDARQQEPRAVPKPAQAVMPAAMAVAVGASSTGAGSPTAAAAKTARAKVAVPSLATPPLMTAAANEPVVRPEGPRVAPDALVAIRAELRSLLELLSN